MPPQASVGIYLTAIHDIDMNRGAFGADFYLWAVSPAGAPDPLTTLQVTRARTQTSLYQYAETVGDRRWSLRKYRCELSNEWALANFPFDSHVLAIAIELNPDAYTPVDYVSDQKNSGMGSQIAGPGWQLSQFSIFNREIVYQSNLGDPKSADLEKYPAVVSTFKLWREPWGLFLKLMGGAYLAACAALLGGYLQTDQATFFSGRINLQIGCLFATVINHRAAGGTVGRADVFTLPDALHLLCYLFIFVCLMLTIRSRRFHETGQGERVTHWERRSTWWLAMAFLILNVGFVVVAALTPPHADTLRTIEVGD